MRLNTVTRHTACCILAIIPFTASQSHAAWNPKDNWKDSYSVGGKCYCDSSNYDHNLSSKTALTPIGELNVVTICEDINGVLGDGPSAGRIPYNDIQCGNGPANDAADEAGCPGRVDIGSAGCDIIGPKWDLVSVYGPWPDGNLGDVLNRANWELSASNRQDQVALAIDGQSNTRWATGTAQTSGQWFSLDLKSIKTFNAIVLETAANPNDYPRAYNIATSDNGQDWSNIIETGAGAGATTTVQFDAVQSRYVRIEQTGSASRNWWSIHEINLYNSTGDTPEPPIVGTVIPATIQAEDYSSQQGIRTQSTSDTGGGDNVGWIENGDYTEYEIHVPVAGSYTLATRIASKTSGGEISIQTDDQTIGTITVDGTNGWQNWSTVSTPLQLEAGNQTVRLTYRGNNGYLLNINWLSLSAN